MHRLLTIVLTLIVVTMAAAPLAYEAKGCVVVDPLPDDVHGAIRHYRARDLYWYLRDPESLDIPEPETGRRPLMTALLLGKTKYFRELLRRGANPDLTDPFGNTALHIAAQTNQPRRALELLEAGANPLLRNMQHQTFMTYWLKADERPMSSRTRRDWKAVLTWLDRHNISVENHSQSVQAADKPIWIGGRRS